MPQSRKALNFDPSPAGLPSNRTSNAQNAWRRGRFRGRHGHWLSFVSNQVFPSDDWSVEDSFTTYEIKSVIFEVAKALRFIPSRHALIVATRESLWDFSVIADLPPGKVVPVGPNV